MANDKAGDPSWEGALATAEQLLVTAQQELVKAKRRVRQLQATIRVIQEKIRDHEPFPGVTDQDYSCVEPSRGD